MSMSGIRDPWAAPFATLKELRAVWPSRGWSWDGRLACVSSSFSVDFETRARAAVVAALPGEWNPVTIQRAPAHLREVADRTGGLRPGQALYSGPSVGVAFVFGLWWPWGDGMTTSMRIGLANVDASHEPARRMREVFGVEA